MKRVGALLAICAIGIILTEKIAHAYGIIIPDSNGGMLFVASLVLTGLLAGLIMAAPGK